MGLERVALGDGGGPHGSSVELLASEMESLSEACLALAPPLRGVLEPVLRRALALGTSRDENLPARRMPRPPFGAWEGKAHSPGWDGARGRGQARWQVSNSSEPLQITGREV